MAKGRKTGGRAKGKQNASTTEVARIARELIDNPIYRANLATRINAGTVPPAVETMFWHYAHGKPPESFKVTGADGGPVLVRIVDAGAV